MSSIRYYSKIIVCPDCKAQNNARLTKCYICTTYLGNLRAVEREVKTAILCGACGAPLAGMNKDCANCQRQLRDRERDLSSYESRRKRQAKEQAGKQADEAKNKSTSKQQDQSAEPIDYPAAIIGLLLIAFVIGIIGLFLYLIIRKLFF